MAVEVRPVSSGRERRAFVGLPYRLHAGTPWVPPLRIERRQFLSKRFSPFAPLSLADPPSWFLDGAAE